MLILSAAEVSALLDLDELLEALRAAMIDLSAGRVSAPPRVAAQVPEHDAMLAAMPASLPSAGAARRWPPGCWPGRMPLMSPWSGPGCRRPRTPGRWPGG